MSKKARDSHEPSRQKGVVIPIPSISPTPEEELSRRKRMVENTRTMGPLSRGKRERSSTSSTAQTAGGGVKPVRTNNVRNLVSKQRGKLDLRPSNEAGSSRKGVVQSRVSQYEGMAPPSKIPRLHTQQPSTGTGTGNPGEPKGDSVMQIDDSDPDSDSETKVEAKNPIAVDDMPSPTSARDLTKAASAGKAPVSLAMSPKARSSVSQIGARMAEHDLSSTASKVEGFRKPYSAAGTATRLSSLRNPDHSLQGAHYLSSGAHPSGLLNTASIQNLMKPQSKTIAMSLQPKQRDGGNEHDESSSKPAWVRPPSRPTRPVMANLPVSSSTGPDSKYFTSASSKQKAAETYKDLQTGAPTFIPGSVMAGRRNSVGMAPVNLESPSPPASPTSMRRPSAGSSRTAKRRQTQAVLGVSRQNIPAKQLTLRGVKIGTHVQRTDMSAAHPAHCPLRLSVNFMRRSFEITGLQDGSVTMKFDGSDIDVLDYLAQNRTVIVRIKPKTTMESVFEESVFDPSSSDSAINTMFMCWQPQSKSDNGVIERIASVFTAQTMIGTLGLREYAAAAEELTKACSIDLISSSEDEQDKGSSAGTGNGKIGCATAPMADDAPSSDTVLLAGRTGTGKLQNTPKESNGNGDGDGSDDIWGVSRPGRRRTANSILADTSDLYSADPSSSAAHYRLRPKLAAGSLTEIDSDSSDADDVVVSKREFSSTDYTLKFEYPLGERKATSVTGSDISRLYRGEFLNDTIMEFYMRYISEELRKRDPELHNECFFFNTFFFKKLSSQRRRTAAGPVVGDHDPIAALHGQLKRWVGNVDLLTKKYIFVPINENLHWYLAIITNPGLLLVKDDDSHIAEGEHRQVKADAGELNETDRGDRCTSTATPTPSPSRLWARRNPEDYRINSFFPVQKLSPQRSDRGTAGYDSDGDARMDDIMPDIAAGAADAALPLAGNSNATADGNKSGGKEDPTMSVPETPPPQPAMQRAAGDRHSARVNTGGCNVIDLSSPLVPGSQTYYGHDHGKDEASPHDSAMPEPVVIRFKGSEIKVPAANYHDPNKHPYILILDSLGSRHQTTFKLLREYISSEVRSRTLPAAADISSSISNGSSDIGDIKDSVAQKPHKVEGKYGMVPLQTNMCDCGVFVLHYVDEFLIDPQALLAMMVNNLSLREWFAPGMMLVKREGMLDLATALAKQYAEVKEGGENGGVAAGSTIDDLGTTCSPLAEPKQDGAIKPGDSADACMATTVGDTAEAGSAAASADPGAEKSTRNGSSAPDDLRDATAAAR